MRLDVVMGEGLWQGIRTDLFDGDKEGFAFGLARPVRVGGTLRFVLEHVVPLSSADYAVRGRAGLALTREASSRFNGMGADAAALGLVPVHMHSHPRGVDDFSSHDDEAEENTHRWLRDRGQPWLLSLVQAPGARPRVRLWREGAFHACGLRLGLRRMAMPGDMDGKDRGADENVPELPALDRQRAFGSAFSQSAARLRVGVVGVGGVGMPVAEMLARSGFRDFVLVDPDRVEETNLNRLGHAFRRDVGRFKVELCRGIIRRAGQTVGTSPRVRAFREDINLAGRRALDALAGCDLVLALTDDELSRIACLKLALAHGVEYLQGGVRIGQNRDVLDSLAVEFTGAESGRYCPLCSGRLSSAQASIDARRYVGGEVFARARAEGYIPEEPSPSVMSLNAVAAGALVLEIQKRVAGIGDAPLDLWQHDLLTGTLRFEKRLERKLSGSCAVCGRPGYGTGEDAGSVSC